MPKGIKGFQKDNIVWKKRKFTTKVKEKMSKARQGKYIGPNHPNWKGGKFKRFDGYIYIWQPSHPYCGIRGYMMEHRLIMEQMIGRYLKPTEIVHHINGILDDNRPENLKLFANNSEHSKFHKVTSPSV